MKKYVIISLVVLSIVGVLSIAFTIAQHRLTTQSVEFIFSDISEVLVSEVLEDGNETTVGTLTESGSTLRLDKNGMYSVLYKANEGFANGELNFSMRDNQETINIQPYYSDTKLDEMLTPELATIQQVIRNKYLSTLDNYDIVRGNLYHRGDWYGTTLVYKGVDPFMSDPLRIVLHKIDGAWVIATPVPEINLSIITFPDIPRDILKSTNSYNPNPTPIQ